MKHTELLLILLLLAAPVRGQDATQALSDDDPYLWLEEIDGERAMEWVKRENQETLETLAAHPSFDSLYAQVLRILDSDDRIAYPTIRGDHIYNFWKDNEHERGIWACTSVQGSRG